MTGIYNNFGLNNVNINYPRINFKSNSAVYVPKATPFADKYTSNPLYENFGTAIEIEAAARTNPRIREILNNYNLPLKVNEKVLDELKNGHLSETRVIAAKIYSNLPPEIKESVNLKQVQDAAMLHDCGKVLIPTEILNKKGGLTPEEWEIMAQHAELSAELLKNKNLDNRTLELIKYHHQTPQGDGYPSIQNNYEHNFDAEIVTAADKYTALREERSYKGALSKDEALEIIQNDVENGLISQPVFDALKKAV